jgi:hypothetical protein
MTTVGYGDLVPQCPAGKVVASVSMVLGIIFMAMPIAIVGSEFTKVVEERRTLTANRQVEAARETALRLLKKELEHPASVHEQKTTLEGVSLAGKSPAERLFIFLRSRVSVSDFSIANPSPYVNMLLDTYLGTLIHKGSANTSTWELVYSGRARLDHGARALTLNRPVDLHVGTTCDFLPDPELVLPVAALSALTGITYRVSQRHALIRLPPQFSGLPVRLFPSPGSKVYHNGVAVSPEGCDLKDDDILNFHTAAIPLTYKVRELKAFSAML